ncbi:hypothetical protein TNCV_967881 [Trichonephila clavipes]|nr:hypothetical protein TNCV_967881 [Trichonephila clavipes]
MFLEKVSLVVLSLRDINRTYRSIFAVVVRGRPCTGRHRTCPVSLNGFQNIAMTLLAAPTVFSTVLCVNPDPRLLFICLVMD